MKAKNIQNNVEKTIRSEIFDFMIFCAWFLRHKEKSACQIRIQRSDDPLSIVKMQKQKNVWKSLSTVNVLVRVRRSEQTDLENYYG